MGYGYPSESKNSGNLNSKNNNLTKIKSNPLSNT